MSTEYQLLQTSTLNIFLKQNKTFILFCLNDKSKQRRA